MVELLRGALAGGREELNARLADQPSAGHEITAGHAFLIDQLIRVMHDHVIADLYPVSNRTSGERLAIMAVGGYGRAEMAPHSDVDIAFLTPGKQTAWCEQVIEAMLYLLWDLGLKVGHSSRSVDEMVRMAKGDLTIRTAMLEGRYRVGRPGALRRGAAAASSPRWWQGPSASSSPKSSPSATSGTSGWATAAMSSSPTSRKARAACAICRRSTGSANTSTR